MSELGTLRRPGLAAWLRATVGGLMAVVLVVTLAEVPSRAALAPDWEPPAPPETEGVAVSPIPPAGRRDFAAAEAVVTGGRTVAWLEPETATVELPPGSVAQAGVAGPRGAPEPVRRGRVRAGDLPVRVGAAPLPAAVGESRSLAMEWAAARTPQRVRVSVSSQATARLLGVNGLLLSLARADDRAADGLVTLEVDYSGFRYAFGGNWVSRLRVSLLGRCAAHPARGRLGAGGECGTVTPLATANDYQAGLLAAEVPLAGDGGSTMVTITAGPSGDNGDFTATSLSPASTWQVSAQTGALSWSYPFRTVPAPGGLEPSLALSYSSQTVDGRTANTNTQGSWIGDGWDLWPGYIERQYRTCADDMDTIGGQNPNNPHETGDQCWVSANATMSLNGRAVELVDDGGGKYRPVTDDGSRVELLTDTALGNGDNDGEYWKVTTVDGTQYFFGRHRRPAYPSDGAATSSTWTVPVYGNHPGEPCYQSGDFSGSRCTQAWRWNLDYVVDPHGNSMTYFYQRETGAYARELDLDLRTTYHRGGYLKRIEYGSRSGQEHTSPTPARVMFDVADRCLPSTPCVPTDPGGWPDTPWDQYCDSAPCSVDQLAPTFWTQKRLAKVRTQVWRGSGHADVESWTLRHDYLDAGAADGEGVPMWLTGVTHTGHVTTAGGSEVTDPEVVFDPGSTPLPNRVDGPSDGKTWLNRWRLKDITTESGALVGVIYSDTECTLATVPDPHLNDMRCFPQWYSGGAGEPTLDWFHKYVVESVLVDDLTGASPRMETHWDYLDDPAWHYDDSELVDEDKRTWSQWRGYSQVRVRQGSTSGTQSATEYLFMRGMDGDRASPSGGTKSVQITDSQSVSITDHEAHAGFLREETVLDGVGGAWVSGSIHTPWRHGPTASAGPLEAWLTATERTRTRTALEGGGTRWTETTTTFDTTYGMPVTVDDLGDTSTADDDRCTRYEYARNTTSWLVDKVSRTETVGVACSVSPTRPDDVLSDSRVFYDDPIVHGAAPTRGLPVRTQEVDSWSGSTPVWVDTSQTTFDVHGRPTEVLDALSRQTSTAYTPATGGPVTQVTTTNPAGHTDTIAMEPAWQLPVQQVDPNGHVTDLTYDGSGRLTAVWLPGRDQATQSPSMRFDYLLRNDAPTAITSEELMPEGGYRTTVNLLDGMLRPRQTQTQAPGGGRVLEDTFYDSRGLTESVTRPFYDPSGDPPDTTLVGPAGLPVVPGVVEYLYDGADRVTDEVFLANGTDAWRTSYAYGGDRVHTTPPTGGTATTTITDARDQTVALRQYYGPTPTGSYEETGYSWTLRGELASVTDPAGNIWSYEYDQRGRQVTAVDPDKGTTTATFDAAGQMATATDARGVTLGYTYDALGRRTSVRDGSPTGPIRAEWEYDTLLNGIGQVTRAVRHEGGEQYVTEVMGYDSAGRPTGSRVIVPSSETGLAGTYEMPVTYRPDGSIYTVTLPAAGGLPAEELLFDYNDVGLQTTIDSPQQIYVYEAVFDKLDRLTQRTLGNFGKQVTVTHVFDDPTGRLMNSSVVPDNQPYAMDLAYEYDDAGNLTRIADSPTSTDPNDTQCYRYDHLRRLTEAWTPASTAWWNCLVNPQTSSLGGEAPYWHSWTYDVTGNRLTETRHASAGDTVATHDHPTPGSTRPHAVTAATITGPGGSVVNSYGYDQGGNMTGRTLDGAAQTLTWNEEGRLTEVSDTAGVTSFVYNADGDRLIRRDPDGATLYLPHGQELRYDSSTATTTGVRYYTHLDATVAVRTTAGVTWLASDHHGTAEVAIRGSDLQVQRRRTTPFGQPRGAAPGWWAGDKGFVGGTEDPTGLTHLGARLYDPQLGRFLSVDPIMDLTDPQQMHGYTYAHNNPTTYSDPDGLLPDRDLPGSQGAHDTAVYLRWRDLMIKYNYKPTVSISPNSQSGADIVCWDCSRIEGGPDVVWVWEVKPLSAPRRRSIRDARESLANGIRWAKGHSETDGRPVVSGPMFGHESSGPNRDNPDQLVTVGSEEDGVELYTVTEDDCDDTDRWCRSNVQMAVARALAMKHRDLDESLIHSLTRMMLAIAAAAVLTARYQAGRPSRPAQPTRPGSGRSGTAPSAPRAPANSSPTFRGGGGYAAGGGAGVWNIL